MISAIQSRWHTVCNTGDQTRRIENGTDNMGTVLRRFGSDFIGVTPRFGLGVPEIIRMKP